MFTRKMVYIPLATALIAVVLFAPGKAARAQTNTDAVVACIDSAADKLKACTDALAWYAEALCYARYAADGILCTPALLLKKA